VCIWRIPSLEIEREFLADEHEIGAIAISSDNRLLATGGTDYPIRLWSIPEYACIAHVNEGGMCHSIAFIPHENILVAGTMGGELLIWNYVENRIETIKGASKGIITAIAVLDYPHQCIVGDSEGKIEIWDIHIAERVKRLRSSGGYVTGFAVTNDKKTLLASNVNGEITAWNLATSNVAWKVRSDGSVNGIVALDKSGVIVTAGWFAESRAIANGSSSGKWALRPSNGGQAIAACQENGVFYVGLASGYLNACKAE
jgi:WD40 repeat protein